MKKIETTLTTKASEELADEIEKDLEKEDVAIASILKPENGELS